MAETKNEAKTETEEKNHKHGKYKNWIITCHNPTNDPTWKPKVMHYLGYVLQRGEQTGAMHYQGYVQYKNRQTLTNAIMHLGLEAHPHLVAARGTHIEATEYWLHGETNIAPPIQHGTLQEAITIKQVLQGQRTDLHALMDSIKAGKRHRELLETHPNETAKFPKWVKDYQAAIKRGTEEIKWPIELPWCTIQKPTAKNRKRNLWIWGKPNIGKTYHISKALKGQRAYIIGKDLTNVWDEYEDEEVIVMDDTRGIDWADIISITNVWMHPVKCPGYCRYNNNYFKVDQVRVLIILSNKPPEAYIHDKNDMENFNTRFHTLHVKDEPFTDTTDTTETIRFKNDNDESKRT